MPFARTDEYNSLEIHATPWLNFVTSSLMSVRSCEPRQLVPIWRHSVRGLHLSSFNGTMESDQARLQRLGRLLTMQLQEHILVPETLIWNSLETLLTRLVAADGSPFSHNMPAFCLSPTGMSSIEARLMKWVDAVGRPMLAWIPITIRKRPAQHLLGVLGPVLRRQRATR